MSTSTVKRTSEELKSLRKRGKSKTDWEWLKKQAAKGIEPDMSHADDAEVTDKEFSVAFAKKRVGRPRKTSPKEHVNIRIDAEVLAAFRTFGRGWQTRMNDALKDYVKAHS